MFCVDLEHPLPYQKTKKKRVGEKERYEDSYMDSIEIGIYMRSKQYTNESRLNDTSSNDPIR